LEHILALLEIVTIFFGFQHKRLCEDSVHLNIAT